MSCLKTHGFTIALSRLDEPFASGLGVQKRFHKGFRVLLRQFPLGVLGNDALSCLAKMLHDEVGD